MLSATNVTIPNNHQATADAWYNRIAKNNLAIHPFDYKVNSLVKKIYEEEINQCPYRGCYKNKNPDDLASCEGMCCNYLKGTADWYREKQEKRIKGTKDFKNLEVSDFKTKNARNLRDALLDKMSCGFLHEAYRFRIKANYIDVLYLILPNMEAEFQQLIKDTTNILESFIMMSFGYCSKCIMKEDFNKFILDVTTNTPFKKMSDLITPYINN